MAKALTPRTIEALKPDPDKRLEVPDALLPGLYLIIQPSGRKSWAVRYRLQGKPQKLTLAQYPLLGLAEAREQARAALREVSTGMDPYEKKRAAKRELKADTVRAIGAEFLRRHASKNRTATATERIFVREVYPAWGDRPIGEISRRDVIELVDSVVDRGAPIQANRVLAAIRKFFSWAASRDIISSAPTAGISPPSPEVRRDRILSDAELGLFWTACDRLGWPFGPAFQFLCLTAQRRDEVMHMSRPEVVSGCWTIPAHRAKNKKPHTLKLPEAAMEILRNAPAVQGSSFVFTTTGARPISGYSKAKARLDAAMLEIAKDEAAVRRSNEEVTIPPWTLHDLRRTAASGMARLGVQLPVIERVLNHISGSFGGVAGVYQRHTFADEMAYALDRWARHVISLTRRT